ncbi:regulator [Carbonactinospora thermoautotrophica]|uniref:Regulator n=1 Tax=Carbonactinospora thermoautotrophica TaxID=1469144 RepID=A0A132N001_9ACTN|nr:DUF397 domain-containing protein [Carbonactinospora thermoautotrophica]KWX03387.1 regulator [Carbonactinospora thermoautotrophica]KWX09096.1 regulator [Carbonactinospora thermoautotrophica]
MQRNPGAAKPDLNRAVWRKSTHSGSDIDCVEVADLGEVIAVRDSKNPSGPHLMFTFREWTAFLSGVRGGEFDLA